MRRRRVSPAALLAALVFLALGLAWYVLVYRGAEPELRWVRAERAEAENALSQLQSRLLRLRRLEAELGAMDAQPGRYMPSYNAEEAELAFLEQVLDGALGYTLTFRPPSRDGDQVRRSFSLDFTAASYGSAVQIIRQMEFGPYRCLIGDISCATASGQPEGAVSVSADAVFFETMSGAMSDAGLP